MARYIDADALLSGFDVRKVVEYDEGGWGVDYNAVPVGAIEAAPTVNAVPVRHGRWMNKTERIYADLNYRFDCSVCSHIFYAAGIETFNYCPNCGARMDGDVNA